MVALDTDSYRLERGSEAPDFELPGTDGTEYSLADFEDFEALLVVFTCNHCPYAKAKMDELNYLAETYDNLAVVGINPNDAEEYPDDSFERMQELVEDGTVAYDAYLRDDDQEVAAAYGAVCTPDPFLFTSDEGTFRLAYHGRIDDALNPDEEPIEYEMREYVETVLAGESVEAEDKPSRGCSIKWKAGNEPDYFNV
ncbi:thioredoxin family protein [Halapricum desulfuricans]|uniref:Thiol-disulfide isomerase or thioredoxin n=1 Tax=Halapricum desulfuricans TaxID=2841257 RepID=A0A897NK83_9EURY|nr:thioredoxin family protein [Halapricum desulfuricans]QSG14880.1 Thiol-disulfide isomerase or thioredoxin [Halapricum desulfuricans]